MAPIRPLERVLPKYFLKAAREAKPTHLADASSDQEPIGHDGREESPNSQIAKPTAHSKPNILESRCA